MSKTVVCRKYGEELPALDAPPLPGPLGERLQQTVSKKAWQEWQALQTMLINEKQLRLIDPEARAYLAEQREKFFNNEATDRIVHFTPPDAS